MQSWNPPVIPSHTSDGIQTMPVVAPFGLHERLCLIEERLTALEQRLAAAEVGPARIGPEPEQAFVVPPLMEEQLVEFRKAAAEIIAEIP